MKKVLFFILFLTNSIGCFCQSYLGETVTRVNFREVASTNSNVIRLLPKQTSLFIISLESVNGFLHVIDIETNKEGYVYKKYIKIGELVEVNENTLTRLGTIDKNVSEISIYNNTELVMTLKLGNKVYIFKPKETRKISLVAGMYTIRASAPGVIPYLSKDLVENGMSYEWTFYIKTTYM